MTHHKLSMHWVRGVNRRTLENILDAAALMVDDLLVMLEVMTSSIPQAAGKRFSDERTC